MDATRDSFFAGLEFCKVGYRLSDISHAIQVKAESEGFSVIRDFVGHGVGQEMHEEPQILITEKREEVPDLQREWFSPLTYDLRRRIRCQDSFE